MNILLLEPNYKNKYPPLALMKLSTFHKQQGDSVSFCKGKNSDFSQMHWDRIYITTLFTFEWAKVKETVSYARKIATAPNTIYVGGIAATLMPDFIRQEAPDINIVCGLLNESGKLGLENDQLIDSLPPDYSILEQIDYIYPTHDAYFCYATRGCGMNCSFCAVQQLEPVYNPYISIIPYVNAVKEYYGDMKNLMLMDNNVLKSPQLPQIIDDIIALGFGRGATYINPKTNKRNKRIVDFNQGLDANFLTEDKANLLSQIALEPVRIALDHINQWNRYENAIRTCFNAGLRSFSNYLLYNSAENANWKGNEYIADTPADLYNRLLMNLELRETLQEELNQRNPNERVNIYSFPMRYIPLHDTSRGFVGTHWNKKFLRAIQIFLTPTQGKGISSRSFFNASFGTNIIEFKKMLYMPEQILYRRGHLVTKKGDTPEEIACRSQIHQLNQNAIKEWSNLYEYLVETSLWSTFFETFIRDNHFRIETLSRIDNPILKRMYFFYLPFEYLKHHISELPEEESFLFSQFALNTAPAFCKIFQDFIPRQKESH